MVGLLRWSFSCCHSSFCFLFSVFWLFRDLFWACFPVCRRHLYLLCSRVCCGPCTLSISINFADFKKKKKNLPTNLTYSADTSVLGSKNLFLYPCTHLPPRITFVSYRSNLTCGISGDLLSSFWSIYTILAHVSDF